MLPQSQPMRRLTSLLVAAASLGMLADHAGAVSFVPIQMADGFDFPVGKPNAFGYYRFRGFRTNYHMGDDWNGLGGGNSDLGKPVYSIAHGVVVYSEDYRSNWGNVVIIRHAYREKGQICYVDSLYGHLQERTVSTGDHVRKGQKVGTIGTNRGMYVAHLHFEIRKNINIGLIHKRYAMDYSNYYSPSSFIEQRRHLAFEFAPHPVPVNCFHSNVKNRYSGARLAQLPENPLQKPKPPPRLDPMVREILVKNELIPKPPKESKATAEDPAGAEERAKIRAYWSNSRNQIDEASDPNDRLGHD